jgi:hypothetical protein
MAAATRGPTASWRSRAGESRDEDRHHCFLHCFLAQHPRRQARRVLGRRLCWRVAGSSTGTFSTAGCLGADGESSGTSTSVVSIATLASGTGGCTARASGFAYAGVVGASANTLFNGGGQNGFVNAEAGGAWSDGLNAVWPERFSVSGVETLRLTFNIGATGGVSTSGTFNPQGLLPGGGQADIGYRFSVGGASAQGTMFVATGSPIDQQGQWGTITGSVVLTPTSGTDDDYVFPSFGLRLSGSAQARAGHLADPTMPIVFAQALAEFGATLIWEGITDAEAFDRFGAEIPLPDGFEIGLIGSQTGMNYWRAAVRDTDPEPVPAPASWALVGAGLALLALRKRRSR